MISKNKSKSEDATNVSSFTMKTWDDLKLAYLITYSDKQDIRLNNWISRTYSK